jgi:hypothetical protein
VLSVRVIDVLPQEFTPSYQAFGKIESPHLLPLMAQVEGEITYINKAFISTRKVYIFLVLTLTLISF